jgi:ribonuclease PH
VTARIDGRGFDALRPVTVELGVQPHADGSVLIKCGGTHVLCAASVEERVPGFVHEANRREGTAHGWLTAEYAMLPRATNTRTGRTPGGREKEIQRLVGRALRAAVDLTRLGARTITIDCDVLEADGGTRTASITGGYVALALALRGLRARGTLVEDPLVEQVAAVSAGVVEGRAMLDLCYQEDALADVDMNFVMTARDSFVEVQGTGERGTFDRGRLDQLCGLAMRGCTELLSVQRAALAR